jgi:predicted  nucleic acid-binding Zn-ribbon protein
MSVLGQLYRLQLTDSEWDEKSHRLMEVVEGLAASDEVVHAREEVVEAERALHESKAKARVLELEVGGIDARLKVNQERMYGGKVRNPKELSALSEEAKSLRRRRADAEDVELELMLQAEAQEAELAEIRARLRQVEATWQEQQAVLTAEKEQLESRLAALEEVRGEVRSLIGKADLALYDDLRAGLGGIAVALLRRGMCQVCGVDVPTGDAQAVERGEGVHYCPVCNRLLYGGG